MSPQPNLAPQYRTATNYSSYSSQSTQEDRIRQPMPPRNQQLNQRPHQSRHYRKVGTLHRDTVYREFPDRVEKQLDDQFYSTQTPVNPFSGDPRFDPQCAPPKETHQPNYGQQQRELQPHNQQVDQSNVLFKFYRESHFD